MPLNPLRQQFAGLAPSVPGQAVLGALGGQGPLGPTGAVGGGLQPPSLGAPTPQAPVGPNPQHEALKRMIGRPVY